MAGMGKTFEGLSALGQVALRVRDLDRAVGFYQDILGMKFLFRVPTMGFFDAGGVRLMLGLPESDADDHPGSILYFRVPDIRTAHEALAGRGV